MSKKPVPVLVTSTRPLGSFSSAPGMPLTHHLTGRDFIGYKPPITSLSAFSKASKCHGSQPMSASINIKCVEPSVQRNLAVRVLRARLISDSLVIVSTVQSMPNCRHVLAHLIKLMNVDSVSCPP